MRWFTSPALATGRALTQGLPVIAFHSTIETMPRRFFRGSSPAKATYAKPGSVGQNPAASRRSWRGATPRSFSLAVSLVVVCLEFVYEFSLFSNFPLLCLHTDSITTTPCHDVMPCPADHVSDATDTQAGAQCASGQPNTTGTGHSSACQHDASDVVATPGRVRRSVQTQQRTFHPDGCGP